jgi:hypothetical protein
VFFNSILMGSPRNNVMEQVGTLPVNTDKNNAWEIFYKLAQFD